MRRQLVSTTLVVLAALALGLWLAASEGLRERLLEPQTGSPIVIGAEDCAPAQGSCLAEVDDTRVALRFDRTPGPLEPFEAQVGLQGGETAVTSVVLSFQMQDMDMGLNRFALERETGGIWRGEVMLPVCTTGRRDWLVDVMIDGERRRVVRFGFTLAGKGRGRRAED